MNEPRADRLETYDDAYDDSELCEAKGCSGFLEERFELWHDEPEKHPSYLVCSRCGRVAL